MNLIFLWLNYLTTLIRYSICQWIGYDDNHFILMMTDCISTEEASVLRSVMDLSRKNRSELSDQDVINEIDLIDQLFQALNLPLLDHIFECVYQQYVDAGMYVPSWFNQTMFNSSSAHWQRKFNRVVMRYAVIIQSTCCAKVNISSDHKMLSKR
jgi:hypothetical protein